MKNTRSQRNVIWTRRTARATLCVVVLIGLTCGTFAGVGARRDGKGRFVAGNPHCWERGGPIPIAAVVANVQSALGMRPQSRREKRRGVAFVRANETRKRCLCFVARNLFEDGLVSSIGT